MFRLVGHDVTRQDLASRTEVKFTLQHPDIQKLRVILGQRCRRVVYNKPVSSVSSLYFDDPHLSACRANLDGLKTRRKLRLRWYDTDTPAKFVVEIKWRENRISGKHRFLMESDQPLQSLAFNRISRYMFNVIPAEFAGYVARYSDAIVLVRYHREHFVSPDESLRMTLDYDLAFVDQRGRRTITSRFARGLDGFVVVEGKTPVGRESELRHLMHPFAPRAERCSKYVHGCDLLGHIPGGI